MTLTREAVIGLVCGIWLMLSAARSWASSEAYEPPTAEPIEFQQGLTINPADADGSADLSNTLEITSDGYETLTVPQAAPERDSTFCFQP